ncbi:MAG: hypothetical protein ACLTZY_07785 [Alistipes indistinctus]
MDKTLFPNKIWLWKITWHGPEGYATIYENDRLSLVKTSDGLHYDLVTRLRCDSMPNETALLFGPNDELYLLVRREIGGATGVWEKAVLHIRNGNGTTWASASAALTCAHCPTEAS